MLIRFSWLKCLVVVLIFSAPFLTPAQAEDEEGSTSTQAETPVASPAPQTPKAVSLPSPTSAPTPAPALAPEPKTARHEKTEPLYGKTRGIAGPITFGPSLTLLGLTRPFAFGLEAKYLDMFGFGAFYGYLPQITIKSVKLKYTNWDVRARWYPFSGAFFLAAAIGKQSLTANKSDTISGVPVNATLTMDTTFVTPHVGWHWIWNSGFFMGMDLGVQLPMSQTTTLTTDAPAAIQATTQYQSLSGDITDKANKVGKTALPMLTLLKVGFLF